MQQRAHQACPTTMLCIATWQQRVPEGASPLVRRCRAAARSSRPRLDMSAELMLLSACTTQFSHQQTFWSFRRGPWPAVTHAGKVCAPHIRGAVYVSCVSSMLQLLEQ